MKTIFDHVEHLKGKPHHIRKQVAFGVAALASALIALIWLVGNYTTGTFAISGSSFAESTGQIVSVPKVDVEGNQLAGAAAAVQGSDAPAHIEIVDTAPVAPLKRVEQTTLPF
jgi:hypothetical protein